MCVCINGYVNDRCMTPAMAPVCQGETALVFLDTDPIISAYSVCLTADGRRKGIGCNEECICTSTSVRVDVLLLCK